MNVLQRLWLIAKELAVVAFATRVPTLVVAMVIFLLAFTEPAQDMLAEAVNEAFPDLFKTARPDDLPPSHWPLRWLAIVGALFVLAFTAWYWARVVLMFHRAMPDLSGHSEDQYRAEWRPRIVLWWPRALGTLVFVGCAWGLWNAADMYPRAGGDAGHLVRAAVATLVMGLLFLLLLIGRRHLLPGGARASLERRWALCGREDERAPFTRWRDLFRLVVIPGQINKLRLVGDIMLVLSLACTLGLIVWAAVSPVSLGDGLGGLAISLFAAAVAIPWFTLLTILAATTRFPWFGLAAVFVLLVPVANGWFARDSDYLDNHGVRTLGEPNQLPQRLTIDEALDGWLQEQGDRPAPFIVVATEGGASRAGYWTALTLGELLRQDPKARDSIFAISSVSGGSLGAVLMRALIDLDRLQEGGLGWPADKRVICDSGEPDPKPYLSCVRVFMRRDFLASAFAGMFYTDLLQRPVPALVHKFPDRAETIERSWERSWDDLVDALKPASTGDKDVTGLAELQKKAKGLFGRGFLASWGRDGKALDGRQATKPWPILLLNGTSVETGRRVVTSNVSTVTTAKPVDSDGKSAVLFPCVATIVSDGRPQGDLRNDCLIWEEPAVADPFMTSETDMPVSTAANMSARFPIIEPAGGIRNAKATPHRRAYHVVDGGIYENFGAQTTRDLLHHVVVVDKHRRGPASNPIVPLVVLISDDHELDGIRQVGAAYGSAGPSVSPSQATSGERPAERTMELVCDQKGYGKVPLCTAKLMKDANEVLGDPTALYRTRSGRGESGILGLREQLAEWSFPDQDFFHFRHCKNGDRRPASMTWYVSPISQSFMDELLPSVLMALPGKGAANLTYADWMDLLRTKSGSGNGYRDPCQNHIELKRLIDLHEHPGR
jgi:hypothetical protein